MVRFQFWSTGECGVPLPVLLGPLEPRVLGLFFSNKVIDYNIKVLSTEYFLVYLSSDFCMPSIVKEDSDGELIVVIVYYFQIWI